MSNNQTEEDRVNAIYERREKLDAMFRQLVVSDEDRKLERFVDAYDACIPEVQAIFNFVTIELCGFSIPTIVAKAMADDPDDVESGDFPYSDPPAVTAVTDLSAPAIAEIRAMMKANIDAL